MFYVSTGNYISNYAIMQEKTKDQWYDLGKQTAASKNDFNKTRET